MRDKYLTCMSDGFGAQTRNTRETKLQWHNRRMSQMYDILFRDMTGHVMLRRLSDDLFFSDSVPDPSRATILKWTDFNVTGFFTNNGLAQIITAEGLSENSQFTRNAGGTVPDNGSIREVYSKLDLHMERSRVLPCADVDSTDKFLWSQII